MKLPKFIITMDGVFRLGMVDQHKHLLKPATSALVVVTIRLTLFQTPVYQVLRREFSTCWNAVAKMTFLFNISSLHWHLHALATTNFVSCLDTAKVRIICDI